MIPIDYGSIIDSLKRKGIFPMLLGLIMIFQYNYIQKITEDFNQKQLRQEEKFLEQQEEMKKLLQAQIQSLEIKLLNCETERNNTIIRQLEMNRRSQNNE